MIFIFPNFPKGIDNGQTVRMAVGSREILITFRVSVVPAQPLFTVEISVVIFAVWLRLHCAGAGKPSFPAERNRHSLGCVHLRGSSRPGGLSHSTGSQRDPHLYSKRPFGQQVSVSSQDFISHEHYSVFSHSAFHPHSSMYCLHDVWGSQIFRQFWLYIAAEVLDVF